MSSEATFAFLIVATIALLFVVVPLAVKIAQQHADLAAERAEVERLRADASFWEREHQREQDAWRAERALADRLAEALAAWVGQSKPDNRSWADRQGDAALAAWREARQ